jgi:hypothetical protein
MRKFNILIGSLGLLLPMIASATQPSNSGTMGVSCTVDSSLGITISQTSGGVALTSGNGSDTTTFALGHVRAYGGTLATNLSRVVATENTTTYSTPFTVRVILANATSSDYKFSAALTTAATGHSVLIDSTDITDGSSHQVDSTDAYASDVSHTMNIVVPHTSVAPTVSDAITFTVLAN